MNDSSNIGNSLQSRRQFVKKAASGGILFAAGTEFATELWSMFALKAEHGHAALDLQQMQILASIAAQVIPTDDMPGAREAGVLDFIDTRLRADESLRQLYKNGLAETEKIGVTQFGSGFAALTQAQQKQVLASLEKSPFFQQVLKDIVEAFAHSSVGQAVMGYPGGSQPHGYHTTTSPSNR